MQETFKEPKGLIIKYFIFISLSPKVSLTAVINVKILLKYFTQVLFLSLIRSFKFKWSLIIHFKYFCVPGSVTVSEIWATWGCCKLKLIEGFINFQMFLIVFILFQFNIVSQDCFSYFFRKTFISLIILLFFGMSSFPNLFIKTLFYTKIFLKPA